MSTIGSSPLARGLRAVGLVLGLLGGIIPARAGFTLCSSGTRSCSADHPRSRGVYVRHSRCDRGQLGSSPLARGLPCSMRSVIGAFRIIPARAGFTCPTGQQPAPCPDHPRSRGVYAGNAVSEGGQVGSSPLARGLRPRRARQPEGEGIIPARAGFTTVQRRLVEMSRDHPRSRGVYRFCCSVACDGMGSSPLARGLLVPGRSGWLGSGIIPARAGFT